MLLVSLQTQLDWKSEIRRIVWVGKDNLEVPGTPAWYRMSSAPVSLSVGIVQMRQSCTEEARSARLHRAGRPSKGKEVTVAYRAHA